MKIAREALPFALPPLLGAVISGVFGLLWLAALLALLFLFVLFFFRDPARTFEGPSDLVLSAADGTVLAVDRIKDPAMSELCRHHSGSTTSIEEREYLRIVTFLSVFNVHIQRCPTEGSVLGKVRQSGRAVAAFRGDAGEVNERHLTVLQRKEGDVIGVRQVVGLVARRIVPYLDRGDRVERGDHLGLIKFGSRVDLLMPSTYEPLVEVGAKVQAGLTAVAMPTDPSSRELL